MRVLTAIIVGLVLLVGISLGSYKYINSSAQDIETHLDKVEQMVRSGRWETAGVELETTKNFWDKEKYWWTILLNHQEIDNIDISISRLESYVETRGLVLSLGELSALKMLVDHIADNEAITIRNIL
ncbi:MAG: DUF4363 family protein [Desulfitobacteriaceae bacterium]